MVAAVGIATIPKSVRQHRIHENRNVFSFSLSPDQIAAIDSLNSGDRVGPDPEDRDF